MKHLPTNAEALLRGWLSNAGIAVADEAIEAAVRHVEWLLETNATLNLTAVVEPMDALRLHAVDSLLALPDVVEAPGGLLVDIGTGGGFPGLPLAVASGRKALLIDSVGKKAEALKRYVLQESLDSWISVSGERSEAIARAHPGTAAVVVARAVAELPALVELASPLLSSGGVLVAMKGRPSAEEIERGGRAAAQCGLEHAATREYGVPGGQEQRTILTYRKFSEATVSLPRREGMATKRPLA